MNGAAPQVSPAPLDSLGNKLALVKDWVGAVVEGFQTGFYLYGTGGIGKSHTVLERLEELKASYRSFNSRMTAKGLYLALANAPDAVHLLEDMERLTTDRDAQGVLRSALWAVIGDNCPSA
jgi:Cdc6-like AAA superfamily ATPase